MKINLKDPKIIKGLEYERFVGNLLLNLSFNVDFRGIRCGFEDAGIDIVAWQDEKFILFVQCKNWATMNISYKDVSKFYADYKRTLAFCENDLKKKFCFLFITSSKFDYSAKKFCSDNNILIIENFKIDLSPTTYMNFKSYLVKNISLYKFSKISGRELEYVFPAKIIREPVIIKEPIYINNFEDKQIIENLKNREQIYKQKLINYQNNIEEIIELKNKKNLFCILFVFVVLALLLLSFFYETKQQQSSKIDEMQQQINLIKQNNINSSQVILNNENKKDTVKKETLKVNTQLINKASTSRNTPKVPTKQAVVRKEPVMVLYNPQSQKYHRPNCEWALKCLRCRKITEEDAKSLGGKPCKACYH